MNKNKVEPKQNRSRNTKKKIIEASVKLFSKKGYRDVTTHEIAAEAGISIGSFYNYFDDKKDALFAALESLSDDIQYVIQETVTELESKATEEEVILELVNMSIEAHRRNAGLAKIVEELRYSDPDIRKYSEDFQKNFSNLLQFLLSVLEMKRGIEIEDIETKAKILMVVVEALCHENIFHDLGIDDQVLAGEIKDLITKYILLETDDLPEQVEGGGRGLYQDV